MVESDLEVPLSPELVLVSPELRERALAEERNGELPSAAPPPVLPAQAPPAPPTKATPAQAPPAPPADPPASPAPTASRWRLTVGGLTVIVLSALVVFGAGFLIVRFLLSGSTERSVEPVPREVPLAETLRVATPPTPRSPIPSRAPRKPAVAAKHVPTPQPKLRRTSPAAPTPQPKLRRTSPAAPTPKPTSSLAPARAPKRATKTVRPIPGGGYVLPAGRFRVSSNGRTIVDFTLETRCVGRLTLQPIRIAPTSAFAFTGRPPSSSTTVRVKGRFVTPTEARGTTQVIGTTCRAPATSFVARLS